METKLIITPQTRIAELLNAYPEIEDALVEIAPAFKNLKNPVLRRTIARVTSLKQAAAIGNVAVDIIVNKLRSKVGQGHIDTISNETDYSSDKPSWFEEDKIVQRYDAREDIAAGGHPLGKVMGDLKSLNPDEIYELTTPFLPAPMIDKLKELGFETWSYQENEGLFRNYFWNK